MKITKKQLRRIIQEERRKLDENPIRRSPAQRVEQIASLVKALGPENFARALMTAMGDDQDRLEGLMSFIERQSQFRRQRMSESVAMGEKLLPGFYRNNVSQSGRGNQGDLEVDFFEIYQALENAGVRIIDYADEMISTQTEQIGAFLFYVEENENLDFLLAKLNREWSPIKWTAGNTQRYMGKNQTTVYADFKGFGEPVYGYGR